MKYILAALLFFVIFIAIMFGVFKEKDIDRLLILGGVSSVIFYFLYSYLENRIKRKQQEA
ncbi:MAG: hypothetical protein FH748_09405 [Balneolaceae bacterium]|nr:hypothetical protein [Balneolaceae bacterium]